MPARANTPDNFWSKVEVSDGCWNWTAGKFKAGYGAFSVKGKLLKAHRYSWTLFNGEIPEGVLICHHCDNPSCVRPDHLYAGDSQSNVDDKMRRGRHVALPGEKNGMWGKRKTHCKNGHELTEENVYMNRGQRHCAVCRHIRITAWNAKKAEERRAAHA